MSLRSNFLAFILMSTFSPIYDVKGHLQALPLTYFKD